ncbi:hypothetical protein [Xanthomonas bromi]|uniref:Uncharacterized protein n=1 Tax=Xanthomonas bromi TaxID=56449 RepID=A0ABX5BRF7_9XANT|nr:hypothetical protein [Xanthomonas bromi]PPV05890.1 hypothetical protein XbrCFBP1976_14890 [Xanthomonas bromi]
MIDAHIVAFVIGLNRPFLNLDDEMNQNGAARLEMPCAASARTIAAPSAIVRALAARICSSASIAIDDGLRHPDAGP